MRAKRRGVLSISTVHSPAANGKELLLLLPLLLGLTRLRFLLGTDPSVLLLPRPIDLEHPFVCLFARVRSHIVCPASRHNAKGVVMLLDFDLSARMYVGHADMSEDLVFL